MVPLVGGVLTVFFPPAGNSQGLFLYLLEIHRRIVSADDSLRRLLLIERGRVGIFGWLLHHGVRYIRPIRRADSSKTFHRITVIGKRFLRRRLSLNHE